MKIGDRNVIASMRNSHGIRVYIPEKLKYNGKLYSKPWVFHVLKVNQYYDTIYSFGSSIEIDMLFNSVDIMITEPFTEGSLQLCTNYVTAKATQFKNTEGSLQLCTNYVTAKATQFKNNENSLSKSDYYALLEA